MVTRGKKIFIGDFELTKVMSIAAVDFSVRAEGVAEGSIRFFIDEYSMDKEGNIILGKTEDKDFVRMSKVKWERSLIF